MIAKATLEIPEKVATTAKATSEVPEREAMIAKATIGVMAGAEILRMVVVVPINNLANGYICRIDTEKD